MKKLTKILLICWCVVMIVGLIVLLTYKIIDIINIANGQCLYYDTDGGHVLQLASVLPGYIFEMIVISALCIINTIITCKYIKNIRNNK